MTNGMKVYDVDTHVTVSGEALEEYLPSSVRELAPNRDQTRVSKSFHVLRILVLPQADRLQHEAF
jgi:hypothetical protein